MVIASTWRQSELALDDRTQALAPGASLTSWAPESWPVTPDWRPTITHFLASSPGQRLASFLQERLADGARIYPPQPFLALELTALAQVKVLILGQDPYHGPGQAQGLAFSVAPGIKLPPSLRNIFKEVARDPELGVSERLPPSSGSLRRWASQGVLLLNTCLTVEEGRPASHAQRGWESLSDALVQAVVRRSGPKVFMLWGAHAQAKRRLIAAAAAEAPLGTVDQLVLTANHPSPLSASRAPEPFLGCAHFSLANRYLQQHGRQPIDW